MITATRPMDRIHPVRGPAPVDRSWRNAGLKAQIVELANDLYQQRCHPLVKYTDTLRIHETMFSYTVSNHRQNMGGQEV